MVYGITIATSMPEVDWADGALIEGIENWLSIVGDLMLDHPEGWTDRETGFATPSWTDSKLLHDTRDDLLADVFKLGRDAILSNFYRSDADAPGNMRLDEEKTTAFFFN